MSSHPLEAMLRPQSVAVIGATDNISRIGGRPVHWLLEQGYAGAIYPVNPKRETIQGLPAYASIGAVSEPVDCTIIAVPAAVAVDAVRDCAVHGVKSVVMFTSGFAEMGEAGALAQADIARIASASGMRVLGPNCLGVFNISLNWYGTFASVSNGVNGVRVPQGRTGIVSQSGAFGAHIFWVSQLRGVGSNYWVTTGNECDVDVAEVIEFYAQADDVSVIMAYVEGVKNGRRMRDALDMARAKRKPVVFMKVGFSETGALAAALHTASLAGRDDIYDALFRQYGAHRADTTQEMVDIAYACQFGIFPTGNRICLQSISGGAGIQMADAASDGGLDIAPLDDCAQQRIKELVPHAGAMNPVDFTANAVNDSGLMEQSIDLTLTDGGYNCHVVYLGGVPASPFTGEACHDVFSRLRAKHPDCAMFISMLVPREVVQSYEQLSLPCFEDPAIAVRAMTALTRFGASFARIDNDPLPKLPRDVKAAPAVAVGELEAKRIIASAGIPVSREGLATSAAQACALYAEIGRPVVMKIASADILHKSEIGGVLLDLDTPDAVEAGYATLVERARAHVPEARLDGVIVSEMVRGGVETVLGVARDPVFGPAVMFGLGGIFVEVLKDVTFRLAPFGVGEARLMIDEIRGRAILDGVQGARSMDVDSLAEALSRLSVFAAANEKRIETIDINPFIVLPEGSVAVDAWIEPAGR